MVQARGHTVVRRHAKDGSSITILNQSIKYAQSDSGTVHPVSGWQDSVPAANNGKYIWTWIHIQYSDGSASDAYSVSRLGIDGKGIQSSVVTYCQKANTNTAPENFPSSDWGSFPTNLTDGYWLYTRTVVTYSDGDTATSYSVVQIGQGSYYAGLQEYYAAFASADHSQISGYPDKNPSGSWATKWPELYVSGETPSINTSLWKTSRAAVTLDASNPYLWNFEISRDSHGNQYVTEPVCIGNFAKGITSVVEAYAISAQSVAPSGQSYPSDISSWVDESHDAAPTTAKPYQWNRTITTYNDNTTSTRYHVSAVKGGKGDSGDDGVIYFLLPSTRQIMRYQDGSLTQSTISCLAKKQVGAALPVAASDCTMKYHYVEAGVTSSQSSYSGGNINIGLWWTEVVFHLFKSGTEIATETVKIQQAPTSPGKNLLSGTNFIDKPADITDFADNKEVTPNALQGEASLACIASPTSSEYINFFRQVINNKIEASQWYTLSFWARSRACQIDVNTTSPNYGFGWANIYLQANYTIKLTVRGSVSSAALNAGRDLRVFVFNSNWSFCPYLKITSTSTTEVSMTFTVPSSGAYQIGAYCYQEPNGGNSAVSGQTVTVEWYQLQYANPLLTYIYPSFIDTAAIQVADGSRCPSSPADGCVGWSLTEAWKYCTFSFKVKSTLPSTYNMALFRLPAGANGVEICMPKLERGVFATAWGRAETDKTGAEGATFNVTEWNNGGTGGITYRFNETLTGDIRVIDIVTVTTANGFTAYVCIKTHTTTAANTIPVTNTTYWQQLNSMAPIYTSLIMAANAVINFSQSQRIAIIQDGAVKAGMEAGEWPIWAGGATPSSAPFRVKKDGSVYGNKAVFDGDSEFGGKLDAAKGTFNGGIVSPYHTVQLESSESYTYYIGNPVSSYSCYVFWANVVNTSYHGYVNVPTAATSYNGVELRIAMSPYNYNPNSVISVYIPDHSYNNKTGERSTSGKTYTLHCGQELVLKCVSTSIYMGSGPKYWCVVIGPF